MPRITSYAALLSRAVFSYYFRFWFPLFLTELIPMSTSRRLGVRRWFRPTPADRESLRARELNLWLIAGYLHFVGNRSRAARYLVGLLFCGSLFLGPVTELIRCLRANIRFGALVESRFGIGRVEQFVEMLALGLMEPESFGVLSVYSAMPTFYHDRMFLAENRRSAHMFHEGFPGTAFAANLLAKKPGRMARHDPRRPFTKLWIYEHLRDANLRTIELIAIAGRGDVKFLTGSEAGLPRIDLFEKPNAGEGGAGAVRWRCSGDTYEASDGVVSSERGLLEYLRAKKREVVIQARMENHPHLEKIGGPTLMTVRVHTILDENGAPRVLPDSYVKIATGSAVVDNMREGGLGAPVELSTGTIGSALAPDFSRTGRHPNTQVTFEGSAVPFWGDVLSLAVRGHEALLPAVVLGFDIAVLADGPMIVEVNPAPGNPDKVSGKPLAALDDMDLLLHHLERLTA